MSTITVGQAEAKNLGSAPSAAAGDVAAAQREVKSISESASVESEEKTPVSLFLPAVAKDFRTRWDVVQSGFVDDPRQAVQKGHELVGQVMQSLAETFSNERAKLEGELSTEKLRIALRRYRSLCEHVLAL